MAAPNTVMTYIRRRSDITEEQFHHHWENIHGPLVAPWAIKHGFEYTQLHTPQAIRETTKKRERRPFHEEFRYFDGAAQFRIPDLDQFFAAFQDPYYVNVIRPDEDNFINKSSTEPIGSSMLADAKRIVANGKAQVDTEKQMKVWQEWESKTQKE